MRRFDLLDHLVSLWVPEANEAAIAVGDSLFQWPREMVGVRCGKALDRGQYPINQALGKSSTRVVYADASRRRRAPPFALLIDMPDDPREAPSIRMLQ